MISLRDTKIIAIVTWAKNEGRYGTINFTTSQKDKNTGERKNSYWKFFRMVGNGFEGFDKLQSKLEKADKWDNGKTKGVWIVIKSFSMNMEPYKKGDETIFPDKPNFVIWDWDFYSSDDQGGKKGMDTPPVLEDSEDDDTFDFSGDDDDDEVFGE